MDKNKMMKIINKYNPAFDEYHTHIRNVNEIKTFREAVEDEQGCYPDNENYNGDEVNLIIYSSKPIKLGSFVSTSKMMAEEYSGHGVTYSKKIKVDEVAWICTDEGIYVGK